MPDVPEIDEDDATNQPTAIAQEAILYALRRIRESPEIGWYCGHGTQMYSLLTEAAAVLTGKSVAEIKKTFRPQKPANPRESLSVYDILEAVEKMNENERREIREAITV